MILEVEEGIVEHCSCYDVIDNLYDTHHRGVLPSREPDETAHQIGFVSVGLVACNGM